ncbi:DUF4870 domain-containing protein [Marivirga arenosa]|uniref:DUF4870 domain-containing protein n=1 Tax=Marivirga arenosa TaxID=3059076 RepID=A0AA51RCQ1_9BACT|nr:DUF4870 domain-containing protein [Marivirga sp. ABR2-2]WMN06005.1 DUF4870 domain-containing protein [Marivirga sp. ABR2-2]
MNVDNYQSIPQPDEIDIREKEDAMGAYLMMFAALGAGLPLPILNLIAAIIYYYINKGKSLFVRFHALQSLLSQLPTSLLNAVAVFWGLRIIFLDYPFTDVFKGYLWLVGIANLLYVVFSLIGAVKARKGEMYYFILFGRLSYQSVFKKKSFEQNRIVNQPPK